MNSVRKVALAVSLTLAIAAAQPASPRESRQEEERPIELGVSGGNINDFVRLLIFQFCGGGTLGALVEDDLFQYILSNNHILARTNKGVIGDPIIQPGLPDQELACLADIQDAVADLSDFMPISFAPRTRNTLDAAIAQVRPGEVDPSGSIVGIGEVSMSVVEPALGMPVKKMGRSTGLTFGTISAIDAVVVVKYDRACRLCRQRATFANQILIDTPGFNDSGDSGSLIVEDCSDHPRAVGLLFAGTQRATFVNPIGSVLTSFGVSMVGDPDFCTSEAGPASDHMPESLHIPPFERGALEATRKAKRRHEESLLRIEGIVGLGIGLSETGSHPVIEVYTKRPPAEMGGRIPKMLEGVPVEVIETGEIVAY